MMYKSDLHRFLQLKKKQEGGQMKLKGRVDRGVYLVGGVFRVGLLTLGYRVGGVYGIGVRLATGWVVLFRWVELEGK